jgi:hypothetical protein
MRVGAMVRIVNLFTFEIPETKHLPTTQRKKIVATLPERRRGTPLPDNCSNILRSRAHSSGVWFLLFITLQVEVELSSSIPHFHGDHDSINCSRVDYEDCA